MILCDVYEHDDNVVYTKQCKHFWQTKEERDRRRVGEREREGHYGTIVTHALFIPYYINYAVLSDINKYKRYISAKFSNSTSYFFLLLRRMNRITFVFWERTKGGRVSYGCKRIAQVQPCYIFKFRLRILMINVGN